MGTDPGSAWRRAPRSAALLALATAATLTASPAPAAPASHSDAEDAAGDGLARVRAAGVLRWGMDQQGGEPYAYEDPAHPGRLTGFEVELADALARQLGVRAEAVQNDWPTLLASLERGTFDVAMNGIEVTPAVAARVAFSRPYYLFTERLVARAADPSVRDLPSLRGKRVGTMAATQAWQMLQDTGIIAVPYEGVDEPFIDLAQGRTDAVLLDDIIVDRYAPRHAGLRVVGDVALGRYAIAVRPDEPALLHALDRALATVLASGELRRILARYGLDSPRQDRPRRGRRARADIGVADAARGAVPATPAPFRLRHLWLFVQGALMTLLVSSGAMLLAVPLGLGLALARLYLPRAGWLAAAYVELFRGTPVLLQLYVLYYGLAPVLSLGPLASAVLGLGLNYAAYEAEIHRAGIAAVPLGQMEAALALGMTRPLAYGASSCRKRCASPCPGSPTTSSRCSRTARWSRSSPSSS